MELKLVWLGTLTVGRQRLRDHTIQGSLIYMLSRTGRAIEGGLVSKADRSEEMAHLEVLVS